MGIVTSLFASDLPGTEGEARANLSSIRVLLVEDILVNQINTRQLLSHWGINLVIASDGWKAVKLCREQEFDIILMDVSMPVMDGLEATMLIRRDELLQPEHPMCPIVAYTSGWSDADRKTWQKVGINDNLHKPATVENMGACLLKWSRFCRQASI